MYIDPFVAGVLATIGVEMLLIFVWGIYETLHNRRNK